MVLLVTMFVALIVQVVFRYFVNMPMGWTDELSLIMWTWLVLWGAAFVVRESDEIRFELLHASVPPLLRRGMTIVSAAALVILFADLASGGDRLRHLHEGAAHRLSPHPLRLAVLDLRPLRRRRDRPLPLDRLARALRRRQAGADVTKSVSGL